MASFPDRLKELRMENKWTQQELSERVCESKNTIGNWETGVSRPKKELTYITLADLFDVTTDYLLGRTADRTARTKTQPGFDENNIAYKEWLEVREAMRMRLVQKGKIKEGDPLPPSYMEKFYELAMQLQAVSESLEDDEKGKI